ncbi:hypothetical protein AOA80_08350 [Methanomassiliicoccales archaeon RumEn M1]|nr:hypothetical protein AOA80_08350 [Methanomassiliicoccales archaeon RumEn M1]
MVRNIIKLNHIKYMMQCEIDWSRKSSKKYIKWTREILNGLGPEISYGPEGHYHLIRPISKIYLLNEQDYDKGREGFSSHFLESGYEPSVEDYNEISSKTAVRLEDFYGSKSRVWLDASLGCWGPIYEHDCTKAIHNDQWSSVILLCIDRIREKASTLKNRVLEVNANQLEKCVFRTAMNHEIGHHYTFGNFNIPALMEALTFPDLNILEGLANWYAYMFGTSDDRLVQAEMAIEQKICYRYYLFLKHADISMLLDCFLSKGNYSNAPTALVKIIGGRIDHNGRMMINAGHYNGVAMDWSGKGATIVAKGQIKALGTMNAGYFITPRIELLIGRFPKDVMIVTNEVVTAADYNTLPSNIIVLPRETIDLEAIISNHLKDDGEVLVKNILKEAGVPLNINQ